MTAIADARILIIATDGFEDSELMKPRQSLIDAGADVTLASLETGEIEGDNGTMIEATQTIADSNEGDYDALLLPGGTKNPDKLRMDEKAVALIKAFVDAGKPVGAICHAPWLLIEADVVRGKQVTGWPSIRTDLNNAGGIVHDQESVTDGNITTSRNPDDIPAFTKAFIGLVEKADARLETA
ncbi:type 1 glutamine amidotransferase domain-containing protein [Allosphingosinicella indica]|uniref:Protease I n=1 Tax=Allosphingosinicella indica TaxID=941907 RepID=A0A1X7G0F1_9SPHN|nr:type 1 glutamine amidotransferase domain-containing protein [Allosphingosinicella indica]SMF61845.1 protease I [Allosphingosinicella indica]